MILNLLLFTLCISIVFYILIKLTQKDIEFTAKLSTRLTQLFVVLPFLFLLTNYFELGFGWLNVGLTIQNESQLHMPINSEKIFLANENIGSIASSQLDSKETWFDVLFVALYIVLSLSFLWRIVCPLWINHQLKKSVKCIVEDAVPVYITDTFTTPYVFGYFNPVIVVPELLWESMSTDEKRAVIAHELSHINNGDHQSAWWLQVAMGLYFWNPFLYLISKKLREIQELAADQMAVKQFDVPERYLAAFVQLLERHSLYKKGLQYPAMAGHSSLTFKRIQHLKRKGDTMSKMNPIYKSLFLVLGLCLFTGSLFAFSKNNLSKEVMDKKIAWFIEECKKKGLSEEETEKHLKAFKLKLKEGRGQWDDRIKARYEAAVKRWKAEGIEGEELDNKIIQLKKRIAAHQKKSHNESDRDKFARIVKEWEAKGISGTELEEKKRHLRQRFAEYHEKKRRENSRPGDKEHSDRDKFASIVSEWKEKGIKGEELEKKVKQLKKRFSDHYNKEHEEGVRKRLHYMKSKMKKEGLSEEDIERKIDAIRKKWESKRSNRVERIDADEDV